MASAKDVPPATGLTGDEARRRLEKFGPNAIPDTAIDPWRRALTQFAVLAVAKFRVGFGIETLRTLAFVVIVSGNQATTYTNRERQRLWSSRRSPWLIGSSGVDVLIASTPAA